MDDNDNNDPGDKAASCAEMTEHAEKRSQQRAISKETIDYITKHADIKEHVRDGATALIVSRERIKLLQEKGELTAKEADAVRDIEVIRSSEGEVITVMHVDDKKKVKKLSPRDYAQRKRKRRCAQSE